MKNNTPVILSEAQPGRKISKILLLASALTIAAALQAQPTPIPTLKARLLEVLQREASGHSPTSEELLTAQSLDPPPHPRRARKRSANPAQSS